ncbi:MAG: hypothetical protein ACE5GJ_09520, partial [Gemmatimonadota bacterium]
MSEMRSPGLEPERWLVRLLPGLPQIRRGRWGEGVAALLVWVVGAAVVVAHPERVAAALGWGWEG